MGLEETINERISAGFLSDTPSGKVQAFFAAYDTWRNGSNDDAQDIQRMEHEAGITQADWKAYHDSFEVQF